MFGVLRSAPSSCALAFGVPRLLSFSVFQAGFRSGHPSTSSGPDTRAAEALSALQARRRRNICVWAAVTEVTPEVNKGVASVEEFEHELDAMEAEDDDGEGGVECSEAHPSPARLSLLQSNVKILEEDCGVAQLLIDAATSRADKLYLGLDISTQSTGYAVLRPSSFSALENGGPDGLLRAAGEAELLEWGCILGSGGSDSKKKRDVVDVGVIVEEALVEVSGRCARRDRGGVEPLPHGVRERSLGVDGAAGAEGPVWVVGVEDFMRRFLPGRSNAKSIFALAQLNGIVKYACQKHLGAKADSFHPSTPRSFYGLTQNKPEGKEMKHIVHDYAISQENGALASRYQWPLSPDGSKADGSYDITDAYLVARYSWHRDVFRAVADDKSAKNRFAESFRLLHADKLLAAEERSLKMFMDGDMPAARGKKKLKAMTERSARNAHRKLEEARFTKAYETALTHWFKHRVLGAGL